MSGGGKDVTPPVDNWDSELRIIRSVKYTGWARMREQIRMTLKLPLVCIFIRLLESITQAIQVLILDYIIMSSPTNPHWARVASYGPFSL
jgi:hypothetical protein